ncbi:MAG: Xaa-Pro peptidase family protein [Clostridiales Family XIII bacterium]|jgi:Xaa-Pro dipeptidase|nr:Xaa-Pro peptidase family protein [Clostridiales Family XIII bacterium]
MPYSQIGTDRNIGIDYAAMRNYRLARVKKMMEENDIGLFVSWDAWNMRYINGGYPTVPCRWAASMVSILCKGDAPILSATTVMDPFRLKDYYPWLPPDHVTKDIGGGKMALTAPMWSNFMKTVLELTEQFRVRDKAIALDACPVPQLVKELFDREGIKIVVPMEELMEMRSVKSPDEIACMKISAAIGESAMYDIQKALRAGIRENDLTAIGVRKQYFHGADEVVPVNIASGWRTNPMHCDYTDKLILAGEPVAVRMDAVCFNGYKTGLGRTFVIGKASEELKKAYAICLKLMQDAIAAVRPGATTKDIRSVWPSDPGFWGYQLADDVRRCAYGHGIGLIFEDGPFFSCVDGEEVPAVTLKEGMTLALETWYGPRGTDFGAGIQETVLVTDKGCEVLTHYPVRKIIEVPLV